MKAYMKDGVPTLVVEDPAALTDYALIDVRGADEFTGELGHVAGARLVTLGAALDEYLRSAPKSQKTLFICRSGARSARATLQALEIGFTDAYNMEGGMLHWKAKGLAVE
jgi:rhodanese-related sulfurtransferase